MAFEDGPYVQAACFCDSVIEDKSGTLSLIRIIDTLTSTRRGEDPPLDMPELNATITMVLMLKSGMARGRGEISIKIEEPSGIKSDGPSMSVQFSGEEKGHNHVTNLNLTFKQEGVYWFWIYLDDTLLTKMPFKIAYNRIAMR